MYASIVIWIAVPGNNDRMVKAAEEGPQTFKGQKGFKSAIYFSDPAKNEYGLLTMWEEKGDYDAFVAAYSPEQLKRTLSLFAGTLLPQRTYFVNNSFSGS